MCRETQQMQVSMLHFTISSISVSWFAFILFVERIFIFILSNADLQNKILAYSKSVLI